MDERLWIGWLGAFILVIGAATALPERKNRLFACGNVCMFTYALLGYLYGESILFLILQSFILLVTLCMLLKVPERSATSILATSGLLLLLWSLALFQDYTTVLFVVGLGLLGVGFAMRPGTVRREVAFVLGSAVIALFSFLMGEWVFFVLNVVFAALSLRNAVQL